MLIIDEKLLEIDDSIDALVAEFMKFPEVTAYLQARSAFENDEGLQKKIFDNAVKSEYAAYRPEIRQMQREINLDEKVYALRLAENDVQLLLSDLTKRLAGSISENIYVDENLPLKKGGSRHDRHHRND